MHVISKNNHWRVPPTPQQLEGTFPVSLNSYLKSGLSRGWCLLSRGLGARRPTFNPGFAPDEELCGLSDSVRHQQSLLACSENHHQSHLQAQGALVLYTVLYGDQPCQFAQEACVSRDAGLFIALTGQSQENWDI